MQMAVSLVAAALAANGATPETSLKEQLERVAQQSIFFGHQSVGMNVLDGLRELSAAEGVPLRIVEGPPAPATFAHAFVAENGNPRLKLQTFRRALDGREPAIALLKFCFVDFSATTDVAELFAEYRATVTALKAQHPRTVFVHVTVPLTTVQGGVKAMLKRALGKAPAGAAENVRRAGFNALLRAEYEGREPLFDLAAAESTRPDGTRETVDWDGRVVPAQVPEYSSDGAHLNETGRRRAARALVATLASLSPAIVSR